MTTYALALALLLAAPTNWFGDAPRVDRAVTADEAVALAHAHSPVLAAIRSTMNAAQWLL